MTLEKLVSRLAKDEALKFEKNETLNREINSTMESSGIKIASNLNSPKIPEKSEKRSIENIIKTYNENLNKE